jgi:glycine oxidase
LKPDILVIGAGVAGLSTAWALHRRGHRVAVVERGDIGRESSWAGAGILSLLMPWNYSAALAELAERSVGQYPGWLADIGQASPLDPEYLRSGMLVVGDASPVAQAWLKRHPAPETPAALAAFGPGLWLPDVAQVRNPRLLHALVDALRRSGVAIHEHAGDIRLETADSQVSAAVGNRRWQADRYVVAAGAWSAELLGPLAAALPVRPVRGQMLLYKAEPGRLPCILFDDGKYLVPRADGHILAGSTLEEVGFDKSTTGEARAALHDLVRRHLPDVADRGPVMHWAGLRPGSPDNVPIVDRHPKLANLYVNAGHFRYGVTLAPACAELLADRIENKTAGPLHRFCAWPDILRAAPV